MSIKIFALCLVAAAASLWGQRGRPKFSWQDYCFKNSRSPVCPGHDFATKPPPKEAASRPGYTNPFPSTPRTTTPVMTVVGGMDWRFADPFADVLAGFDLEGLAASPLAHALITQLGVEQGLTDAEIGKMFDGLSGVNQAALSLSSWPRGERMVVMLTGRVNDLQLPASEAGMKALTVSAGGLLLGHADAVDQAAQRIAMKWPPADLAHVAAELQANNQFWAVGPAAMLGPEAVSTGMKRFSLAVSLRERLTSDLTFEFNGLPDEKTVKAWETKLGAATIEGNTIHVRTSMEASEVRQKFGEIVASPLGERLGDLVKAARYLPVRDTSVQKQNKPVIYGLDEGPRVVTH